MFGIVNKMLSSFCKGCCVKFKKKSKTGYCAECFHSNVHGIKTDYNKTRWDSGVAKRINWKTKGAVLTENDIASFNSSSVCELCNKSFSEVKKCLDHCHKTGKYRGALCMQCNAALGKLGDDIDEIVKKLILYNTK